MKRFLIILNVVIGLSLTGMEKLYAQNDDVYYDPASDNTYQNNQPAGDYNNAPTDRTDGYGNPAYKYDGKDNSYEGTGIMDDDGYYYSDEDDYYYTSRMRRYYTPNYGVNYYSYWFTPSFYFGYNTWNSRIMFSSNPWYRDPWWGWNRGYGVGIMPAYDPFFDPYWSWNFGWNSFSYYNAWSYPNFGYSNMCGFYGYNNYYNPWGCGGWYGGGLGWGGGWGNPYFGGGFYNNNFYNNNYYSYNERYSNNNGRYYYGPRTRNAVNQNRGGLSSGPERRYANGANQQSSPTRSQGVSSPRGNYGEIPRTGVVRPSTNLNNVSGTRGPSNERTNEPVRNSTNVPRGNVNGDRNGSPQPQPNTQRAPERSTQNSAPPQQWNGGNNSGNQRNNNTYRNSGSRQEPQRQQYTAPQPQRQQMQPRSEPQRQQMQPRTAPQRNYTPAPRQNYSPPQSQPRSSSPSPSRGGGRRP